MKNQRHTIRKIVTYLNNPDNDGGFWLPNIQRPFVWSEEQMCRLYDSILREYPISTLLVWKTTSGIRRRKFIDNWNSELRLSTFYVPEDAKKKCLVLDGQQRLQALFIGLCGSYEGRELYFDVLSGDVAAPDDIRYKFAFLSPERGVFPWIKFKDIVSSNSKRREASDEVQAKANRPLSDVEVAKIEDHLDLVDRSFKMEDTIVYQELDSIDNPTLYGEDDVVEIFIRANSGGTKLGKSDLLFSLLSASWEIADESMECLLDSLNNQGFAFDRDFILKTSLVLLGHGARYEVEKFRKEGVRESVEKEWDAISHAILDVLDFVRGKTYVQCDKALPSYLVLIPLVYLRYRFPGAWGHATNIDSYLLRASLAGAFSGSPDNLLDALVSKLNDVEEFDLDELYGVIRSQGRSLELTQDRLWQLGYGSNSIHLLFNLWYRDFNYTPSYQNNLPEVDHIFPQSLLRKIKISNPRTGRKDLLKFREADRNQLANCMLLSKEENGAGGKGDTPPHEWFAGKSKEYLQRHLIPDNKDLWVVDRFEEFIEERKKLIQDKFKDYLVPLPFAASTS
jgi:hypothetical protein